MEVYKETDIGEMKSFSGYNTNANPDGCERIKILEGSPYIEEIKLLITEYTKFLNRDLAFQHLQEELADLKIKYTKPNGELFAAVTETGEVAGCVAFYRHSGVRCEMKRLYVKPEFRRANLGRRLVEAIISAAGQAGYQEMVLDTIRPLQSAIHLYQEYGFQEIPAYYHNPMEDVIYMKLDLQKPGISGVRYLLQEGGTTWSDIL